jgi:hypothetical protein
LWSIILPSRLRAALRRTLGMRTVVCGMRDQAGGCGGDCQDCPLRRGVGTLVRATPLLKLYL